MHVVVVVVVIIIIIISLVLVVGALQGEMAAHVQLHLEVVVGVLVPRLLQIPAPPQSVKSKHSADGMCRHRYFSPPATSPSSSSSDPRSYVDHGSTYFQGQRRRGISHSESNNTHTKSQTDLLLRDQISHAFDVLEAPEGLVVAAQLPKHRALKQLAHAFEEW
jgi:hypothetical protein